MARRGRPSKAGQRIPGIATEDQAMAILATDRIEAAAMFGAKYVRLGSGHRIVIEGGVVVTVLPPDHYRRMVGRIGIPRFRYQSRRKDT